MFINLLWNILLKMICLINKKLTLIKAENRTLHFMKTRIISFFPSLNFSSPFSRLPLSYLLLTFLTLFAGSVASAQIPSSGLVGYWPFNGNANDESGNGNNGTVNGATLTTDRFGNANSAYSFDGVDDFIAIANTSGLTFSSGVTFSAWISSSTIKMASIVDKVPVCSTGTNGFRINVRDNGDVNSGIGCYGVGIGCVAPNAYTNNIWKLVTGTWGPDGITKIYIDGQLVQSIQSNYFSISNSDIIEIGKGNYSTLYEQFHGKIDDISIYNRALTPTEITQLYNEQSGLVEVPCTPFLGEDQTVCAGTSVTLSASGSSLACPTLPATLQNGLVGYWPFCGNANDASGNGNNGTVNGATLTTDRFGNANSAYSFNGVSSVINISSQFGNFGSSDFTFSTWAKLNLDSQGGRVIVGKRNASSNGNFYQFGYGSNGSFYELNQSSPGDLSYSMGVGPVVYTWTHITYVRQGTNTSIYQNGFLIQTSVTPITYNFNNDAVFSIGARYGETTLYQIFEGLIDDISAYNRALSASEIQQLYTLGQSTYLWSTGSTTATINVTPTQTTTYTCTVTDANGNACTDSVTVFVPQIEATDLTICAGESTTLSVSGINPANTSCSALPTNLQTGLVGYWPFCGNANDASGNGNHMSNNGAALATDRFGNPGQSYMFNGAQWMQSSSSQFNGLNQFSMGFWCKSNFLNNNTEYIVHKGCENPTSQGVSFRMAKSDILWGDNWTNSNGRVWCNSTQAADVSWHHVVMSYNNQSITVYIDGLLNAQSYQFGDLSTNSSPLYLATKVADVGCNKALFYNGKLDDVTLHNRALNAAEIQQLYTLGQTTYLWSNGATTPTINVSPTTTTTYTCTVTTNGVSCTDEVTVVVSQPVASITPNGIVEICQGQSIALTANGGTSYLWNTGAPTQSITVNTEAVYTVTVTDANGCTDTESQLVKVNFLPNIGVNNASICPGQSTTLTATGGLSYVWSPATGLSSATGTTVTASPSTSTVYTVTGTGANGCTNTATAAVAVNAATTATITPATATTFCQGGSVVLNANTGSGLTYQWRLNGTNITGATTSSYTANASGSYTVVVTNTSTCSATSTATVVTVNALPTATITAASATTFCQGGSVVLNANTGAGLSYQWRLNGNPISGATSSSYTANASGSYTVVVTNASSCSSTSTATVVTVNALPTSTITASSATTFCQGGSVVLNANTGTGLSYQWRLNGTNITGATSSSYTANASGSYTVVVTNTSTCSATSTATVVTVNALPTATITASSATTFCQGGSVVLNANTGAGLSYQWFNNASAISGATSASYTANASGSYTVVVTNTSTCSATSTATVVTVNALPTATITPATATTFCQGGSVVLNANTGTGFTYQWRLNGTNITGATTSSYSANASGSYTVVVTNASTCSATSTATVVTVNALPTATITPATATTFCQGASVVLNANTGTGLSYQWFNNAVAISGATTSTYTANASGSYTVVVTNTSTCSATSTATVVTVNALPTATITPATTTTFCQGGSVVLNANTGAGLTYQWRLNGNPISGATSSSYTANASGSYTVVVTNTSMCSATSTATVVTVVPNVNYYADADGDGFGDAATLVSTCIQPQGYVTDNTDCDDTRADINPAATEVCNHIDDDCSGTIDDGLVFDTYYADADGDTYGDANTSIYECSQPNGYVTNNTDCNDNNANQNAASAEICNGEDDDCDGQIDNGMIFLDYYADIDSDGFGAGAATNSCVDLGAGYVTNNTDCNDNNANQNTASAEICNGEDDDCDGTIDNGITFLDYYADADGDGFGAGDVISSCSDLGAGYVSNNTDCDDSNSNINSSATETCNTIDDNCDGQIDEGVQTVYFIDNDGDTYGNPSVNILACTQPIGYTPDDNDCNDTDANINPGAEDIGGNGIDENCDGEIDNSIFELNATISLYPNPTRSELNIQVNSSIIGNDLYIFDAVGKLVHKQQLLSTQTTIPVSNFADGNYVVRVGEVVKRFVVEK